MAKWNADVGLQLTIDYESTWRNNWRELTVIKKAKRRSREKALSEMLFMMFRSAARDRYKLS